MKQADYIRLTAQIAVLEEIAVDYSGKTIDNIIKLGSIPPRSL